MLLHLSLLRALLACGESEDSGPNSKKPVLTRQAFLLWCAQQRTCVYVVKVH